MGLTPSNNTTRLFQGRVASGEEHLSETSFYVALFCKPPSPWACQKRTREIIIILIIKYSNKCDDGRDAERRGTDTNGRGMGGHAGKRHRLSDTWAIRSGNISDATCAPPAVTSAAAECVPRITPNKTRLRQISSTANVHEGCQSHVTSREAMVRRGRGRENEREIMEKETWRKMWRIILHGQFL